MMQSSYSKIGSALAHLNTRTYAKLSRTLESNIRKSVYISQSNDVYTNLALEEWLYRNFDFDNHHLLLVSQNNPSVVIGCEQNPWLDTNHADLHTLVETGVSLARRSTGGSASYHDNGGLNLSFFTPKEQHNTKYNSQLVARSLFREFGCQAILGSDDELYLRHNKQMTNKSVKLGQGNSYHNMSLMVKMNKVNCSMALQKHHVPLSLVTNKTGSPSSSAQVMNLCEEHPTIAVPSLIKAIGWEFLRTKALTMKDGGMELAHQQKGFHMINPTEDWFPGLNEIRDAFKSWDWCYGKTPNFNITRSFRVPGGLLHNNGGSSGSLNVTMTIEKGLISDITIYIPYEFNSFGVTGEAKVIHSLKGKRFSVQAFRDLEESFDSLLDEKDRFVTECVKQVMTCA